MLNVARTRLERAGLRNVQLRQGDIYALPVERDGYDLVIVHQVLHYLDDPARAVREAVRVVRPGGRLVVVEFAPHAHEFLREQHAHRRLGFAAEERRISVDEWEAALQEGRMTEAFACGTAAVITPVGEVKSARGGWTIHGGQTGPVAARLRQVLLDIQHGLAPDTHGWMQKIV